MQENESQANFANNIELMKLKNFYTNVQVFTYASLILFDYIFTNIKFVSEMKKKLIFFFFHFTAFTITFFFFQLNT